MKVKHFATFSFRPRVSYRDEEIRNLNRLHHLIADTPGKDLAIIDHDGRHVTYDDLRQEATVLAGTLQRHGLRGGDRLILVAENCALFASAVMAASACDLWLVLVNARQSAAELAAITIGARPRSARMRLPLELDRELLP